MVSIGRCSARKWELALHLLHKTRDSPDIYYLRFALYSNDQIIEHLNQTAISQQHTTMDK